MRELLLDWIEICLVGSVWKDVILKECVEGELIDSAEKQALIHLVEDSEDVLIG